MDNFMLLLAAPPSGSGGQGTSSTAFSLVTFALLFLVMYFFLIRPQSKKRREMQRMRSGVRPGDTIMSMGGIYGVITRVDRDFVILKVDDDTSLKIAREAVQTVISQGSGNVEHSPTETQTAGNAEKSEAKKQVRKKRDKAEAHQKDT